MATNSDLLNNAALTLRGNVLTIEIDLSEIGKLTAKGKHKVVASTGDKQYAKLEELSDKLQGHILSLVLLREATRKPVSAKAEKSESKGKDTANEKVSKKGLTKGEKPAKMGAGKSTKASRNRD